MTGFGPIFPSRFRTQQSKGPASGRDVGSSRPKSGCTKGPPHHVRPLHRVTIAAAYGYEDGESIPRDLMLEAVGRIVASTSLPVTADLEGGYGDAAETVRRAIGVDVVGANIEDQLKPVADAARQVETIMKAQPRKAYPTSC